MMKWTFVFSILILMFTISVETSSAFNFTLEPSDSIAAIGQPLLLNCQVQYTGSETVVISWQNNGNWLLDPTNQPWTYLANNSLYYRSIPARSIGTFRCGATIFGTSQIIKYSRRATVQAAFIKSEFNPEPGNATKRLGEDATFNCLLTESLPYASIHWEKNEQLYTTGETSQFHIPNTNATSSSLLLRNITFGSSGWYGCVAVNHLLPDQPQRSEKAYLTVLPAKDAPHINIHPSHKIAGENTPAIIQCQILGEPAPAISWTQDGQPVVPSSDRYILSNGSLYFAAPVHRSYAGQYICMGMNSHGSVSSSPILFTVAYLDFGFVENPSNRTATVGDPVSLNCIPPKSYPPQVTIQWYHNYKLIVPSADININSAGTITFAAIKKSDEGIYFCDVTNAFVQVTRASTTAYVTVHVPPSFQVKPSNTNVTLGHPLALNCQAMGSPLPDVTWSKDNQPVDKRHVMVLSNGSLTISATVVGDAGKYSCVASNVAGSSEAVGYVVIYVPPSLVSSSVNTTRAIGESVTFECSFNGIPNPGIQWFYHLGVSQVQLTSSAKLNLSGGLLEIKQIVKQDEGLYTCRAVNLAGQSNASVYLTVQVPASLDNSLVNVTVNASSPASFHCNASGDPQPNVTWFKSGTPLSTGGRIVIGQDSLTILNTVVSDAGQYSCNVSNGLNHHVGVAYLIVQVPPSITSFQVPLLVASGMNTTLTCEASGIPLPRITWHRNGSRISYPFVRPLGSGNYIVDNVGDRDGGVYTCVAENAAGRMTLSANLIVQVAPSSPVPISAIPTSSRSIQLSWKPDFDGHSPITGYKVEMKLESESYTTIEPIILGTSYSVHNLKPFTNYTFKISAINAVGESEGAEISNRTLEDAPSAPRHVTATALNSTAVNVTWYEPAEPNGRIKRYEIHYNAIGSGNVTTRLLSANQLTAVFDRLMHFTGYQFRVRAATGGSDLMWGNFSLNTNVTTAEAAPSAPPQDIQLRTLSSDSILVTWKPVPENSAHGIVRKYIVYLSAVGPHRFSTPRNESVYGSLNITLRSLFPWTQYNVSVQAFTVQAGPRSPWKQKQTEEAAPGVPSDFTIVAHSQQNITVYIASPLPHLRNGIILGYTVFYRPAGLPSKDSYSNVTTNSTGAITEVTLVNLTVYTEYAFRTAAFTSVGLGNLSEEKTMFTPEGVPGTVDHVTAIPLTYDSVNVSWLPPESPNGKITLYMITYNASDGNSSGSVTTPGLLTINLTDLTSNTTYYIFVTAKTSRGFGQRGVMVNATTSPYVKPPPVTSSPTTVQTTAVVPATDARTGGLSDERLIIIIVCIGLIVLFIMVAALYFCVIRPRRQPADQGYSRSKSRKDFRSAGPTAFELHGGRHSLQAVLDVHEEPSVADTNYSSDSFDSDWVSGGVPSPSPVPPLGASGHYAEPADAFKSETPESAPHGLELRNKRISLNSQDSYYDQTYSSVEELGGGFSSFGPPPPLAFRSSPINEEDSGASDQSDDKRKSFTNELYKAMSGNEDKHLGKRGNSYEGPQGGDVTGVENKGYDDDDALNELLQNELLKSSNGLVTSTPSATSPTDLDALYAKPDKSKKKKTFRKNGVVSPPAADSASDCSSELGPINIDDLYAKPEKSKKQSRKHATMDTSTPDAESRSQKRLHEPSVVYDERTNL